MSAPLRGDLPSYVLNELNFRQQFISRFFDPRRNYEAECGYPIGFVPPQFFRDLYNREAYATRVVQLMPFESWQVQPDIKEDEKKGDTAFEEAFKGLSRTLHKPSWYRDAKGGRVFEYLKRADELCGIGSFGCLLLGIDDGKGMHEPVDGALKTYDGPKDRDLVSMQNLPTLTHNELNALDWFGAQLGKTEYISEVASKKPKKLLFMRPFDESMVSVVQYETNPNSPRFSQPVMYRILLNDPMDQNHGGIGLPLASYFVHWSRVIHFADNLTSSEIFGVPRIRPVLNPILDIYKVTAGGAEGYWRACIAGISLETHPQLGGEVQVDAAKVAATMENYFGGMQRYILSRGLTAKTLAPNVVDPTPHVEVAISKICVKIGCPIRVFKGSERGELASSQDDDNWNDRKRERQHDYITPRVLSPFVDRLILLGILPEPNEWYAKWPDVSSLSPSAKSTILVQRTTAMAQYSQGANQVMAEHDYLTREMGYDEDEADEICKNAEAANVDRPVPEVPYSEPFAEPSVGDVSTGAA